MFADDRNRVCGVPYAELYRIAEIVHQGTDEYDLRSMVQHAAQRYDEPYHKVYNKVRSIYDREFYRSE